MLEITVHDWLVFPSLIGSSVFKIKSKAYLKAKRTPLNKLFKRICTFEYCQSSPVHWSCLVGQTWTLTWTLAWALTSPNPSPDFALTTGQAEKKQLTPNWGSVWSLRLREPDYAHAPEVKGLWTRALTARRSDDYGMLKSPNKAKQLAMAATARVIWLCGCMWYWPGK